MAWRSPLLRALVSLYLIIFLFAAVVSAKKKPPLKPVNINLANFEELQQVPGIGPVTAEKILQMRKSYGTFKSVDDLLAIPGLGQKRLDKMRKYLTVGKVPSSANPAPSTKPVPQPKTSSIGAPEFKLGRSCDQTLHQSG